MNTSLPPSFILSLEVAHARQTGRALVALETAVVTHGLPYPENIQLALQVEEEVRAQHAVPATVGLLDGKVHIGLNREQLEILAQPNQQVRKISRRDFGIAVSRNENGGTTVAGTLFAAHQAGLKVFATGGIGGVHRDATYDVSADLPELGRTPVLVVCTGAKSILDLPATLEYLETVGVPVVGYQTDEFPAFFSRESGLPVTVSVDGPSEAAAVAREQWNMGIHSAVLVVVPPPAASALPREQVEESIAQALSEAESAGVHGPAVTPYLLKRVTELSGGASLRANLALLRNNARVAAQIANELYTRLDLKHI